MRGRHEAAKGDDQDAAAHAPEQAVSGQSQELGCQQDDNAHDAGGGDEPPVCLRGKEQGGAHGPQQHHSPKAHGEETPGKDSGFQVAGGEHRRNEQGDKDYGSGKTQTAAAVGMLGKALVDIVGDHGGQAKGQSSTGANHSDEQGSQHHTAEHRGNVLDHKPGESLAGGHGREADTHVIADEPTTALDVTIQAQVLELMKKLKAEYRMSMIMITHDLGVVAEVCDKVAVLYAGNIVEYGAMEDVFDDPRHPYTRALFDATPTLDGEKHKLNIIKGFSPDPIHLPEGCAFHPRCKEVCDKCSAVMPEMVEVAPGHLVRCVHAVPCGAEKTEEVAE